MNSKFFIIQLFWFLSCVYNYVWCSSDCIELLSGNMLALLCPIYEGSLPPANPSNKLFAKLQIESASFSYKNAFLSRQNFTTLQSLTYLRIVSSRLERIDPDTFVELKQLTHLDLSKNQLSYIEPGTFRGLKLQKLILSDNRGIHLPNTVFSGASIFSFVARDCDLRSINYKVFENSHTKHINLANNKIQTLSYEFTNIIQPSQELINGMYETDQIWGSVDLTNNSLICDCDLLWFSKLMEYQRKSIEDRIAYGDVDTQFSNKYRSLRNKRTTSPIGDNFNILEETYKPIYDMNITCKSPQWKLKNRFPIPSEFDCPAPRVVGIDIAILRKSLDAVQLTCHAQGKPTPNVAWTFKQHNQEVHRIIKSPDRKNQLWTTPTQSYQYENDHAKKISIGLNVSLNEFETRDFSCITWTESNSPKLIPTQEIDSNPSNKFSEIVYFDDDSSELSSALRHPSSSIVPIEPLSPDRSHRVFVRLRGHQPDNKLFDLSNSPIESILSNNTIESSSNNLFNSNNIINHNVKSTDYSPYQILFVKRFTPLHLIAAILGTFTGTLVLLFIIARFIPYCCLTKHRYKSPTAKEYLLGHATNKPSIEYSNNRSTFNRRASISLPKNDFQYQNREGNVAVMPNSNGDNLEPGMQIVSDCHFSQMPPITDGQQSTNLLHNYFSVPSGNTLESGSSLVNAPGYWPPQEYGYSPITSHEYDVPRSIDSLAGAMPIAPNIPRNSLSQQASSTLLRRVQGIYPSSHQPSATETPQTFIKMSSGGSFIFPQVAAVPPLLTNAGSNAAMAIGYPPNNSPFIPYQNYQSRAHSQLIAAPAYFNNAAGQLAFGQMANGSMLLGANFNNPFQPNAIYSQHEIQTANNPLLAHFNQVGVSANQQATPKQNNNIDSEGVIIQTEFTSEKNNGELNDIDNKPSLNLKEDDENDNINNIQNRNDKFIGADCLKRRLDVAKNVDWGRKQATQPPLSVPISKTEY